MNTPLKPQQHLIIRREGHSKCSNCDTAERDCHVRPSKRKRNCRPPSPSSTSETRVEEADQARPRVDSESPHSQREAQLCTATEDVPLGAVTGISNPISDVDVGFLQICEQPLGNIPPVCVFGRMGVNSVLFASYNAST
jgi:hypothetical protein